MSNKPRRRPASPQQKAAPKGPPTSTYEEALEAWQDSIATALDPHRVISERLAAARRLESAVRGQLVPMVVEAARREGYSWREIGHGMGITGESLRQRFGPSTAHAE